MVGGNLMNTSTNDPVPNFNVHQIISTLPPSINRWPMSDSGLRAEVVFGISLYTVLQSLHWPITMFFGHNFGFQWDVLLRFGTCS